MPLVLDPSALDAALMAAHVQGASGSVTNSLLHVNFRKFATACRCPNGHSLERFVAPHDSFVCDACDKTQAKGGILWGCRQCNFDLCTPCFCRSFQCPQGHQLKHFANGNFICDCCDEKQEAGRPMHSCRKCDIDIC